MITIGLTGGIASGKSEVGRMLGARGARVVDADRVAHEVYTPGGQGFEAIVRAFGGEVVAADGTIDRRRLGQLVFGRPERLKQLTDIVWPGARELVEAIKREEAAAGRGVLVIEAPLLLEAGWRDLVDIVWLVRAPLEAVRGRVRARDGLSEADAEARISARAALDPVLADLVIENEGDLAALAAVVDEAWLTLRQDAGQDSG